MHRLVVLGALAGSACATPVIGSSRGDRLAPETAAQTRARVFGELQTDILSSYQGDFLGFETVPIASSLIDPKVGAARIGAGPKDIRFGSDVSTRRLGRWPLLLAPSTRSKVVSRQLDIHLSADPLVTAAWMSDEVSWEVPVCGETAAFPLRITALYARDGDQWYPVFEHVSYARRPTAYPDLRGARMSDAFSEPQLADYPDGDLGAPLAALLSANIAQIRGVDPAPPAPVWLFVPGPRGVRHGGGDVSRAQLATGSIQPEDRRVGQVGAHGTIAYWAGNFVTDQRAGGDQVRLRGTFVFEKRCATPAQGCRPDKWFVVQGHLSEPIEHRDLAQRVFGSTLLAVDPLRFDCSRRPVNQGE